MSVDERDQAPVRHAAPRRDREPAEHRARAHDRQQSTPIPPAPVPNVFGRDERDHDLEVERERADHRHHQQRRADHALRPRVAEAFAELALGARHGREPVEQRRCPSSRSATITATYDAALM